MGELAARPADVGRHDVAALPHQSQRLLDGERQAAGAVVEQGHELAGHPVQREGRLDQGGGLVEAEGVEGDAVHGAPGRWCAP